MIKHMKKHFYLLFIPLALFWAIYAAFAIDLNIGSGDITILTPEPYPLETAPTTPTIIGGDKDAHGCLISAGYSWCEVKNKCLRMWEEACPDVNPSPTPTPTPACQDKCGDNFCAEIVCLAIGCPCAESNQSCPGDCPVNITTKKAQTVNELKNTIDEIRQKLNDEAQTKPENVQPVWRNQNTVREAVHALLAMENLTGGIGQEVSVIARDFNNSVQATIKAEEKIQKRGFLTRILLGGDRSATQTIEQEVSGNLAKIQQIKQLENSCNCNAQLKAVLAQQVQNMEQEQNRLTQVAQNEKKSKGIFSWVLNLLKK